MLASRRASPIARHIVDCLALACAITPIYTVVELVFLGTSTAVSLRARAILIILLFSGLGTLLARGRDVSMRWTGVANRRSEPLRIGHDLIFNAIGNAVIAPSIYIASGASWREALVGTLFAITISACTGPLNGLAIDRFRSWAGFESSPRFARRSGDTTGYGKILAFSCADALAVAGFYALRSSVG
jgi:hypothetical protein